LAVLAPVALLATAAVPAMAADQRGALYAAPANVQAWSDMSVGFGTTTSTNRWNTDTGTGLWGEARTGLAIFYGIPLQIDISGNTSRDCNDCSDRTFDAAAHLGLFSMPGGSLGVMLSTGSNGHYSGERFTTIAGEGVWGLSALGGARLVVQGGWSNGTDGTTGTYLHGVIQAALSQNVMLSAGLGFANTNDDEHYTRYGAQVDLMLNPMLGAFVRWDGQRKTEGSYSRNDNRLLFGGTISVNRPAGGGSPLHDFNLFTGTNSDFRT